MRVKSSKNVVKLPESHNTSLYGGGPRVLKMADYFKQDHSHVQSDNDTD
jgi:hypothetical protein